MRQYQILYKRLGQKTPGKLQPHTHAPLYDRPEVQAAIEHMRVNPHIDGIAMLLDGDRFNIMSFTQDAEAPDSFQFGTPKITDVLRDQLLRLHELTEERLAACQDDSNLEAACAELSALLKATQGTIEALAEVEEG